jgi:hypothetical protein
MRVLLFDDLVLQGQRIQLLLLRVETLFEVIVFINRLHRLLIARCFGLWKFLRSLNIPLSTSPEVIFEEAGEAKLGWKSCSPSRLFSSITWSAATCTTENRYPLIRGFLTSSFKSISFFPWIW